MGLHWIVLMVAKEGDGSAAFARSNVCFVPTTSVDQCDTPAARLHWLKMRSLHDGMLDQLKCCPSLQPGDAVFYREDVAHRTQDQLVDRLSMVIQIDTRHPEISTPEDVRCEGWANEGLCAMFAEFMQCICPH